MSGLKASASGPAHPSSLPSFLVTCPMLAFIRRLMTEEDGPTAVEYAVMLALIVGVCITSVTAMAQRTGESFDASAAELSTVLGS